MQFAIIENNTVVNVAVADEPLAENWIASDVAAIGDTYENNQFIKPQLPVDPMEYQRLRAAEYPAATDYLDGIVKGDQAQVQAYINACLAVKAKYPKPS